MGFAVVCALQNDSIADPVIATPVSPIPTATTRSGANKNVGRARETSHMPIAVTRAGEGWRNFQFKHVHGCRFMTEEYLEEVCRQYQSEKGFFGARTPSPSSAAPTPSPLATTCSRSDCRSSQSASLAAFAFLSGRHIPLSIPVSRPMNLTLTSVTDGAQESRSAV